MTYPYPPAELKAPEGTKPYTPWIWLIVVLLILPALGYLFIDWNAIINTSLTASGAMGSFAMFSDPGYLFTALSGWISYGLCALFAYFDWRELQRRGVPKPFHFAWVFLYIVPYTIGRSVVVRRRTGEGIAPMWISIAVMVASFALGIYAAVMVMVAVFDQVSAIGYGV